MIVGYECMLPGRSGVEISTVELLGALVRSGSDVLLHVFTTPRAAPTLPVNGKGRVEVSGFAGTCRLARTVWQQYLAPRRVGRSGLDVYHATAYVLAPRPRGVPAVLTIYDVTALEFPRLTSRLNALHFRYAVPRAARAAARIIVPSACVARKVRAMLGVPAERITVIPLGVSPEFRPLDPGSAEAAGPGDEEPYLLFVGNIERKKNLPMLVCVLAELRRMGHRIRLVLAGDPGNDARRIAALARKERVEEAVVFTGYVDRPALVRLYRGARALVYPSWDEGFGLPPLEAMACGAPVVASSAGALPETTAGAAILVEPSRPREWCAAIDEILRNPRCADGLRRRGIARAAELSWDATAGRVLDVYRAVAGRDAAGRL